MRVPRGQPVQWSPVSAYVRRTMENDVRRPALYQGISEGPELLTKAEPSAHEKGQGYAGSDAFVFDEDTFYAIGLPVSLPWVARAPSVASSGSPRGSVRTRSYARPPHVVQHNSGLISVLTRYR